ncbi:MAG: filamentous hemagglutinin N-terminal domain-containing protein [Azospirillaceae bacterium]|nr:filamentous hemagglutinin N-terminal domain-containing protein [Azospirillaceae bacterium]
MSSNSFSRPRSGAHAKVTRHVGRQVPDILPGAQRHRDVLRDTLLASAANLLKPAPKSASRRNRRAGRTAVAVGGTLGAYILSALLSQAHANPTGGTVTVGAATINASKPNTLTITQGTDKAAINWQSFSIGAGETVNFVQPSSSSVILNRVIGSDPSSIFGTLTANGTVMLVNPNGVIFGAGSRVDVGSLVATTANISDADFLAGRYNFNQASTNPNAAIVNAGDITIKDSGLAALVAPSVQNSGVIHARLGKVALGGAQTFTLDFQGDGLLSFDASSAVTALPHNADGSAVQALVVNSGQIVAEGGVVQLSARAVKGVVDHVINTDGVIVATSVGSQNGKIILSGGDNGTVAISGTVDASGKGAGETGGTVIATGADVAVAAGAVVDASGDAGGGTIAIGSDGTGTSLATAQNLSGSVSLAAGATLNADALTNGDGGRVTLLSQDSTLFSGNITAKGGANGGNGGSAEVSSHEAVTLDGGVTLTAAKGKTGTLLLDPSTLEITNGSSGSGTQDTAAASGTLASTAADSGANTVSSGKIVALTATSDVVLQATGQITVDNLGTVNLGSGHSLTLQSTATGGITFLSPSTTEIVASGGGNITLQALGIGSTITNVAKLTSDTGIITISANGNITLANALTGGGVQVTSSVGSITNVGTTNLISGTNGVILSATGGSVGSATSTISTHTTQLGLETGGDLFVTNDETLVALLLNASHARPSVTNTYQLISPGLTFDVTDTGSLNLNSLQQTSSPLYLQVSGDRDVVLGNINVTSSGYVAVTATGGNIVAGSGMSAGTPLTASAVKLTAQGSTGVNGAIGTSTTPLYTNASTLIASAGTGGINVSNGATTLSVQSAVAQGGAVQIANGAADLTVGTVTGGTVTLSSGAAIQDDADATTSITANSLSLTAVSGIGTHADPLTSNAGTLSALNTNGGIFLNLTNTSATTLSSVQNTGTGAIEVATAAPTTVTNLSTGGGSGDDISLTANGLLTVNTINAGSSGNVTLTTTLTTTSGDGITTGSSGSLITGRNLVLGTSSVGYVTLNTAVAKVSGTVGTGATITQATGDLTVGDLKTTYVISSSDSSGTQPSIYVRTKDGSITVAGTITATGDNAQHASWVELYASQNVLADSTVTTSIVADEVELRAKQSIGTSASHLKTNTTNLDLQSKGDIYVDNAVALSDLYIEDDHATAGTVNTVQVTAPYLTFSVTDTGSQFLLTQMVGTTLDNLEFTSDETLVLGRIQASASGEVYLEATSGDILDDGDSQTRVSGGYVRLYADEGSLGTAANPLNVGTDQLSLTTYGNLYVSDDQDLSYLSLDAYHNTNGSVNSYVLTAPSLAFSVTDSTSAFAINTLTDVTGLNASIETDRTVTLGNIDVTRNGTFSVYADYGSILDDANTATQVLAGSITLSAVGSQSSSLGTSDTALTVATGDLTVAAANGGTHVVVSMPVDSATNTVVVNTGSYNSGNMVIEAKQGDLQVGALSTTGQAITLIADAGSITDPDISSAYSSTPVYQTLTVGTNGTVTLQASGGIGASGAPILISGSGATLNATASAGDIQVSTTGTGLTLNSLSASGDIAVTASAGVTLGTLSAGGTVGIVSTSGSILDDGNAATGTTAGAVVLTATGGSVGSSANALSVTTADLTITSQGSIDVADTAALSNLTLASTSTSALNSFNISAGNISAFNVNDSGALFTVTQLTATSALNLTFTGSHAVTVLGPVVGNDATDGYGIITAGGSLALATTSGALTVGSAATGGGAATLTSGGSGTLTVTSLSTGGGAATLTSGGTATLTSVDTGSGALAITVGSGNFVAGAITADSVSITAKAGSIVDDGDATTHITADTVSLTSGTGSVGVAGTSDSDTSQWIDLSGVTSLTVGTAANFYVKDDTALTALALNINGTSGTYRLTAPTQTYLLSSTGGVLTVLRAGHTTGGIGDLDTFSLYTKQSLAVGTISTLNDVSLTVDGATANITMMSGYGGIQSSNGPITLTTENAGTAYGNIGASGNALVLTTGTLTINSVGSVYIEDDLDLTNLAIVNKHPGSDTDNAIAITAQNFSGALTITDGATQLFSNGVNFAIRNGHSALNLSYTSDRAIQVANNFNAGTTGSISLTAGGSISAAASTTLTAGSVGLSATATNAVVGSSGAAIGVNTANLSVASSGNIYVADSGALSSLTISNILKQSGTATASYGITATNITDSLSYSNSGNYGLQISNFTVNSGTVDFALTSNALITVGSISTGVGTGSVSLTTTGAIQAQTSASRITTGALTLNATGVSVYNDGTDPFLTTASSLSGTIVSTYASTGKVTGGSIYLSNTGDLALGDLTAGLSARIITSGAITSAGGVVTAPTLELTATGGSIGTAGAHLAVDAQNLTLDSGNDIYVDATSDLYSLAVTDHHVLSQSNTLSITAPHLVFDVTDTGSQFDLVNVVDTSGLDFSFTGDKDVVIGTVNGQMGRTVAITSSAGNLTAATGEMVTGDTVNLTAHGSIGTAGTHIQTTALSLGVSTGADIYVDNTLDLSALSLTTTQTGATGGVFAITATGLTFAGGDDGTYTHIDQVSDSTGINFTAYTQHSLEIGTIDTRATGALVGGLVSLTSQHDIVGTDGSNHITAAETTLMTANNGGSVGVSGTTLNISSPAVNLDTSGSVYLNSDVHIDDLSIYSRHPTANASTYDITSVGLALNMTDDGTGPVITNITDTTGLALSLTSDKTMTVGTINLGTTGTAQLYTTDGDIKGDGDATTQITAASLTLDASNGNIGTSGTGNEIDAQVNTLSAYSPNGGMSLGFSASAALKGLTADGDVTLYNSAGDIALGSIDLNGHALTVDNEGGSILSGSLSYTTSVTLTAQGSIGNVSAITTYANGAATTVTATAHAANGASGSVNITETNSSGSLIASSITAAGDVTLTANNGGVSVGTVNAGTGTVTITAGAGDITGTSTGNLITGSSVSLVTAIDSTGHSIGASGTAVNVATQVLTLTGTKNVYVSDTATLTSLTLNRTADSGDYSSGGTISLAATGLTTSITDSATTTTITNLAQSGLDFTLNTNHNVAVGTINVGSTGSVDLTVTPATGSGSILATGTSSAITTGSLVMAAGGTASSIGNLDFLLGISATDITASAGTGGIYITPTSDINLSNVSTTGGLEVSTNSNVDVTLGSVSFGATSNLTVITGGAILGGDGALTSTGRSTISLTAGTGIGSADDALQISAPSSIVSATVTGTGDIYINSTGAMTGGLTTSTADGYTSVTSAGSLLLSSATSSTDNSGDGISVVVSSGNLTLGGAVTAGTTQGQITLSALTGSVLSQNSPSLSNEVSAFGISVNAATGIGSSSVLGLNLVGQRVNAVTTAGNIYLAPAAASTLAYVSTGGGNITIANNGTIYLGNILSDGGNITVSTGGYTVYAGNVDAGTGNVNITASSTGGVILDDGSDLTRIIGNTVTLATQSGIGTSTRAVQTTANTLSLTGGSGAGVHVDDNNTNGVTISSRTTLGDTVITTAGPTTLTSVTATPASNIGANITVTDASGDLTVGTVSTGTAGGTVTLTATTGAILAASGSSTNVTAYSASLSSKTGIGTLTNFTTGAGAPIVTAVGTLTALSATDAGSVINVKQTGNLTLGTGTVVTLGTNGSAYLQATGNIDASSGLPNVGTGDLALLAGGTLTLASGGVSTQGDLYLKGTTDIVAAGVTPRAITISADSLKFISGAAGGSTTLTTTVGALDAELTGTTTAANLTVSNTGSLSGLTLATAKGNITFTNDVGFTTTAVNATAAGSTVSLTASTGDLTVGSGGINATSTGTVNLTATTGALVGEGGSAVTAGTLNLTSLKAIGSASQALVATAATLSANVTGTVLANGTGDYGIYLSAPGTLSLAGLTTADGVVSITGGGSGTTLTSTGGITAGNGHAVTLTNSGGAISVSGSMTAASLDATATTISVGGMSTSGAQHYTGATTITGDLTASAVTVTGGLTLGGTGTRTIDTSGSNGAIGITGALTGGSHALTLTSGTGAITLGGAASGLAGLTATGGSISTAGVTSTGDQSYTGATTLNGTYSTTGTGTIAFNSAVTLGGDTAVTTVSKAVTFSSTIDGAHALTINSGNATVTLTGAVGATTRVGALTVSNSGSTIVDAAVKAASVTMNAGSGSLGTVTMSGGSVDTTGNQGYTDNLILTTNTTLSGGTITVNLVDATTAGAQGLTIDGNLVTTSVLGGTKALSGLSVTGSSSLGASVSTTGTQTYTGAATLTGTDTLTGSTVTFSGTLDGARALTITGNAAFDGTVGGTTALTSLSVSGTTALDAASVTTTGIQTYTGAVTLADDTTLTGTTVTLTNGANGTTAGQQSLSIVGNLGTSGAFGAVTHLKNLSISGTASLTGTTTTAGTQTYGGAVTLAGDTTLVGTTITLVSTVNGGHVLVITGDAALEGTIGGTTALTSLSVSGASVLSGSAITTTGTQTYTGAVTLARSTGVTALNTTNSAVLFGGTVDGNGDALSSSDALTINAGTGNVTFSGIVGGTTRTGALQIYSGGATTFDAAVTAGSVYTDSVGTLALNTGSINTTGSQAYGEAVSLTADTTLTGSNVTLSSTVDGAHKLTITGNATLSGIVGGTTALSSLSVSGTSTLSKNVTTTGTQTYTGAVTVAANDILTGSTVAFSGTVNGGHTLAIVGNATFADAVGTTNALTSLSVSGTAGLNGGAVKTTGSQAYTGAVTLGADTTLTSTGNNTVLFSSTVNGAQALIIANGTGATTFAGIVGGTTALSSLSVSGTSNLASAITTTGDQTYTGLATLSAATTTLTGGTITLTGGADGTTNDAQSLTVAGNLVTGTLGATHRLNNVSVTGAETLSGSVTTAGTQTYSGDVTLGANAVLTGTTITFSGTLNGAHTLSIVGNAGFSGVIGGTTTLTSLSVSGTSSLSGDVTTTGTQTYTGAVTIAGDTTLTGTTLTLTNGANGTTDGQQSLSIVGNLGTSGAFGAVTRLKNLSVSGTASLTGTTTTAGTQTYSGALTLAGDTTLVGSTVTLDGTVNGAHVLIVTGNADLEGTVGATTALTSLSVSGATTLGTDGVTTTGGQTYTGAVTLANSTGTTLATTNGAVLFSGTVDGAGNLTVGTGSGNVTFTGAVGSTTRAGALTVNSTGATTFGGAVKATSLATNAGGTTALNGGSVDTTATQTYSDAVTLGADTTLAGTTITLNGTTNGVHALAVAGNAVLNGVVGGTTALTSLSVSGTGALSGNVTTTGTQTYTGAVTLGANDTLTGSTVAFTGTVNGGYALAVTGNATFGGTVGAGTALTSLSVSGTTGLNGGALTTTGGQTYTGAVTLGADTTLTSTVNGAVLFSSTVNGAQALLISNGTGNVTFAGAVGGTTRLGALTVTSGGATAFNAAVKAASLTTDAAGTLSLAGGSIDTTGTQTYSDAATLGADTTLTGSTVTLNGTVNGAHTLAVTGNAAINGVVGGSTALTSLSVSGTTRINASGITTTGTQTYTGAVTLAANPTLTGSSVTFSGTLDGYKVLAVVGNATFGGPVGGTTALSSLYVSGTAALNGGAISTVGNQTFHGAVTLGADTTLATSLAGSVVSFSGTLNGAHGLIINNGSGAVTFSSTIGDTTRLGDLTVNTSGTTTFSGAVKAASVTTDAGGTVVLGAGVDTTGTQIYNDAATLTAAATLKGTGVTFGGTLDGAKALTITGDADFGGAVGGTTALTSLSVSGATLLVGGAVNTTGAQTYTGAVTLAADTTLTGSTVGFVSTLDGGYATVVTGNAVFGGAVGGSSQLASLSVSGTTALNGGGVKTNGGQTYTGAVTLGADANLTTFGGNIVFASTLDGAKALIISNGAANVTFTGAVGATTRLGDLMVNSTGATTFTSTVKAANLSTNAGGTVAINGGSIDTTGAQSYGQAAILGADTTLTGTSVTFSGTLNGAHTLAIAGAGSFYGVVGGTTALTSLSVSGSTSFFGGGITTTGAQTYSGGSQALVDTTLTTSNGAVTFGGALNGPQALTITAGTGDVTFNGTVGNVYRLGALTVNTSGVTTFGGAVKAASVTTDADGTLKLLGGSVDTTGAQTYGEAATLVADTTLTATTVTLTGGVDATTVGGQSLSVVGNLAAGGALGATKALKSVSVTGTDTIAADVSTTGAQTYLGAVTLASNVGLTGSIVTFSGTLDGARTLAVTGNAVFGGTVGGTNALTSLTVSGTTALNGGAVTADNQIYGGAVTLGADTTLTTLGGVVFNATLDGAKALTITAGDGGATFTGAVGGTTRLGALTVNTAGGTVFDAAVKAARLATDAPGTLSLAGGSVDTTGSQVYGESLVLTTDTVLKGSSIIFIGTVDGAHALAITGDAAFAQAVGQEQALTTLSVSGNSLISGGVVTTTGTQAYTGAVAAGCRHHPDRHHRPHRRHPGRPGQPGRHRQRRVRRRHRWRHRPDRPDRQRHHRDQRRFGHHHG